MSESRKPIGRITARIANPSGDSTFVQIGAIWPSNGKGKSLGSITFGGRNKDDQGNYADTPVKVVAIMSDGRQVPISTAKGSGIFVDLYMDQVQASGGGDW
jgi:hypothetical protein